MDYFLFNFSGVQFHYTMSLKKKKVMLTALKHELDNTTVATFTGSYEGALAIYRCKKCGGTFENFGQTHCCWCGRKIVG